MKGWLRKVLGLPQNEDINRVDEFLALNLRKNSPEWISQQALGAWRSGQLQSALQLYNQAISLMPNEASLYLNRGNLKFEMRLVDEAIYDLEEAVSLNPKLPAGNLSLLRMLKANPQLLEHYLAAKTKNVPENRAVDRAAASGIAKKYLAEHPVEGINGVEKVVAYGEPGSREPAFYHPEPIDPDKCWIAYAGCVKKPNTLRFGGSYIIIISKETGKVLYAGLDGN